MAKHGKTGENREKLRKTQQKRGKQEKHRKTLENILGKQEKTGENMAKDGKTGGNRKKHGKKRGKHWKT